MTCVVFAVRSPLKWEEWQNSVPASRSRAFRACRAGKCRSNPDPQRETQRKRRQSEQDAKVSRRKAERQRTARCCQTQTDSKIWEEPSLAIEQKRQITQKACTASAQQRARNAQRSVAPGRARAPSSRELVEHQTSTTHERKGKGRRDRKSERTLNWSTCQTAGPPGTSKQVT